MTLAGHRQLTGAFSTEALCARILERHRDVVRVQKPRVAIANLARIIEATLKLSNRQGFHATSLRDLSEASGISMGGLYSCFDNKTTLLLMLASLLAPDAGTATVSEVLGAPPEEVVASPSAHLRWLVDTHVRLTEAMQPWFAFAYMEAKSFPSNARRMAVDSEAATEEIFADVLRRGVANGDFEISDITLTASLIKPLLQDWYVKRAKYRRRNTTIAAYVDAVCAIVEAAVARRRASLPGVSLERLGPEWR